LNDGLAAAAESAPMRVRTVLLAVLCAIAATAPLQAKELRVLAAGSLREVIGDLAQHYQMATGGAIAADFRPSGVLRGRIEQGDKADLFASADMGHPLKLLADGRAVRVAMFTRNALCGFALPKAGLTTANFLDRLLDPAVKLGTSTPKADPAGDYTWLIFRKADALHPGAYAALDAKAQKIVGGPGPTSGDPVADELKAGTIDVMIGYCSGRQRMAKAIPGIQAVDVPEQITAGPEYGLAVLKDADPQAQDLALYILSPQGQQIFAQFGFAPVGLPTPAP
jgi:molybdate transport system substrate-binding protein